ncbi:keratin, type I cytoskeletal 9-like isoform X2 [Amborella trichopoda]|uniref:keratin, type I cytoskeletal 9-like isoform X2 n=1 Tax=Amborella trichopoda TaxID=13333 RepID=UPI0009C04841|nr:keratin, type I cytoskeletal 9-like isoform X2 [Amborella trichopoda]|eukprot:XP_020528051.1 keratin, type I cytoskeletal 9-like isoform X2 [Amborella trichopoda]
MGMKAATIGLLLFSLFYQPLKAAPNNELPLQNLPDQINQNSPVAEDTHLRGLKFSLHRSLRSGGRGGASGGGSRGGSGGSSGGSGGSSGGSGGGSRGGSSGSRGSGGGASRTPLIIGTGAGAGASSWRHDNNSGSSSTHHNNSAAPHGHQSFYGMILSLTWVFLLDFYEVI